MSFPFALPMITDGCCSCAELTGEDPDTICSEERFLQEAEPLRQQKKQAIAAGVTALLSPTGGIMHNRLEDFGLDEQYEAMHETLTGQVLSCAGKAPVGGVICENLRLQEEYGETVFESAFFDHLEKMTLLKDTGAAFVWLENFDKLWDMRAAVLAAQHIELPVFVKIQVDEEGCTKSDTDYIAALVTLQALGADAFGIECTAGAEHLARLIKRAFPHAEIPLIAAADFSAYTEKQLQRLIDNGAAVFMDKSRRFSDKAVAFLKAGKVRFDEQSEKDSYAAASYRQAFFLPQNIEVSEPLPCRYDISDELIDLDDSSANAIYCILESTDDAAGLADNADMSYLPFVIFTNDATTLEAALRYYQGRLLVDAHCDIEEKTFQSIIQKYGAILY